PGAMAAAFAPAAAVAAAAAAAGLAVAAYNGAHAVVSGPAAAVDELVGRFEAAGVRCARLPGGHAFHSPLLDPALAALERAAAAVAWRAPGVPVLSTLTGAALPADGPPGAAYWARQARAPVQFARAVAAAAG